MVDLVFQNLMHREGMASFIRSFFKSECLSSSSEFIPSILLKKLSGLGRHWIGLDFMGAYCAILS